MKAKIKKLLLFLILAALITGGAIYYNSGRNQTGTEYAALEKAGLPLITLSYLDSCESTLYGYVDDLDIMTIRPDLLPVTDRRKLNILIDKRQTEINRVIYQLRSIDGSRLVGDGILEKWSQNDSRMESELQLTNLMENGEEYLLELLVQSGDRTIHYYSRVMYLNTGHTDEMLNFVHTFSDAALSEDASFIISYLQPNESMDIADLGYINIHSRYKMFTWYGLKPVRNGEVKTSVTELSDSQMSAQLSYQIKIADENKTHVYDIEEYFVVRFRNDTLYLLDYDRYMTEQFAPEASETAEKSAIILGITSISPDYTASPDGSLQTYVYDGRVILYNQKSGEMSEIYASDDGQAGNHKPDQKIEVVRISNAGSIDFIVYGYFARGAHEGQTGVSFMRYHAQDRTMTEQFYIPSAVSEEYLEEEIGGLAYVSDTDLLYFLYGGTIYSIDLESSEKMELATLKNAGEFYFNQDSSLVAWKETEEETINIMNLESGSLFTIKAEDGEFLKIQGFLQDDLVYGIGKNSDRGLLSGVTEISPMYRLCFAALNETLEETGSYEKSNIGIISTEITDSEVILHRVSKNGASYTNAGDDQIFLNDRAAKDTSGQMKSKQDERFLKQNWIPLTCQAETITWNAGEVFYKTGESPVLKTNTGTKNTGTDTERWYVYGKGGLYEICETYSDAVSLAYEIFGCVLNDQKIMLWNRGTRASAVNASLEYETCTGSSKTLKCCLSMLIRHAKGDLNAAETCMLQTEDPYTVLSAASDGTVLNMTGCSVIQTLYYINQRHPVLAQTGDHTAVLITGYESSVISIYDPFTAQTSQMTVDEAEVYFKGLGSKFYVYLPE